MASNELGSQPAFTGSWVSVQEVLGGGWAEEPDQPDQDELDFGGSDDERGPDAAGVPIAAA